MTDVDEGADPLAGFTSMMNAAREQADEALTEAPFGYRKDGQPKQRPGRRPSSPSIEELKGETAKPEANVADLPQTSSPLPAETPVDRAPDDKRKVPRSHKKAVSPDVVPAYRAGVIATGVNRLYRRAGKIVRAMDPDIGTAIIESARNTAGPGEPDDSVGAAWDELAKTNPRVRKFLMKALAGGAVMQLVMAHAPIAMAIVMKPAILRLIPFSRLIESVAEPDEDAPEGEGGLPGGMTAADAQQMAALAEKQIAAMGLTVPPEVAEQMARAAEGMANGSGPPGAVRTQPRRPASRAKRHS